jgi:hypothetical protein
VTPCALYALHRVDFATVCDRHPSIRAAVEAVDQQRATELAEHDAGHEPVGLERV